MFTINTRSEARSLGLKHYCTGHPCKHGHVSERRVTDGSCMDCDRSRVRSPDPEKSRAHTRAWRARNLEKRRAAERRAHVISKDKRNAYSRAYNEEHSVEIKARKAAYRVANADKIRIREAAYSKANPEKIRAKAAVRRARKLGATPADSDRTKILPFYEMAQRATAIIGADFQVDHIEPLSRGGPHHQANLVVMRSDWNQRKGANYWPWLAWFNEPVS